ncbi:hypothetical protein B0H10DRAFT_1971826 [Mycena sp. CBHHK59/15]|nr:hypothetical protein B0H10DRAFT_1971826 [Mycena sp. CBHHK59/15]
MNDDICREQLIGLLAQVVTNSPNIACLKLSGNNYYYDDEQSISLWLKQLALDHAGVVMKQNPMRKPICFLRMFSLGTCSLSSSYPAWLNSKDAGDLESTIPAGQAVLYATSSFLPSLLSSVLTPLQEHLLELAATLPALRNLAIVPTLKEWYHHSNCRNPHVKHKQCAMKRVNTFMCVF